MTNEKKPLKICMVISCLDSWLKRHYKCSFGAQTNSFLGGSIQTQQVLKAGRVEESSIHMWFDGGTCLSSSCLIKDGWSTVVLGLMVLFLTPRKNADASWKHVEQWRELEMLFIHCLIQLCLHDGWSPMMFWFWVSSRIKASLQEFVSMLR